MTQEQLQACIDLGHQILHGEVDLAELDNESLKLRGKALKPENKKRKLEEDTENESRKKIAELAQEKILPSNTPPSLTSLLTAISESSKTPFQKKVLSLLCQIPRGRFTTYAAMSTALASSPRAVGGVMKGNHWAPEVPCHRVLAANGELGGFKGSWGRNGEVGKNDDKKIALLREEGVKFDGKGRAVGAVWTGFDVECS